MINYLFTILIFLGAFTNNAHAQSSLTYQRKTLEPAFFVPQDVVNTSEKLPPIYSSPKAASQTSVSHISKNQEEPSSQVHNTEINFNTLSSTPRYKQNYNTYLQSIKDVAQTGIISHNPELEADLLKMNSNDRFRVQ